MSITWQVRGPSGTPVVVECYDTLPEAVGSMAGHDGCGGVWEEARESRLRNVDTLVDDESGYVVAVAVYSADDSLILLMSGTQHALVAPHVYTEADARRIAAEGAAVQRLGGAAEELASRLDDPIVD